MTFPAPQQPPATASTNGAPRPAPAVAVQPPADPKLQAVGLALELAKVRATAAIPGDRGTDVDLLLADAAEIAKYIGPNVTQTTVTLRA